MASATVLACSIAVIWLVHPLQTEAVTYISQRAESLMGLFYLLTLYCFIRGTECRSGFTPDIRLRPAFASATEGKQGYGGQVSGTNPDLQIARGTGVGSSGSQPSTLSSQLWLPASILACLLGATAKEIIVTAPVMVLLYDRTFVAGSFRDSWRLRWRYYLGLACTWLLLARLMTGPGLQSVGFGHGVSWWSYALTSCRSVVLYLKLAFWPHPLVFDYGPDVIRHATEAAPYALVLVVLLAAAAMAWRYWPVIGFAGAWFFVILAPTSSVVPVALQPIAEHRMYLSLAAVIALGVVGLHRLIGRCSLLVFAAAAVGLGWLTVQRNQDYRSELALWSDTVAKCPENVRARYNLGNALSAIPGRLLDALAQFEAAVRSKPDSEETHNNFGIALLNLPGRLSDAIAQFEAALRLKPDYAEAHNNLGNALARMPGRLPDAMAECQEALRLKPDYAEAHYNLGCVLLQMPGGFPDAIAQFEAALRLKPDYAEAHYNLGYVLLQTSGRLPEAIAQFEAALRLKPDYAEAHENLGSALLQVQGRLSEAIAEYQAALRLKPDYTEVHYNLGSALLMQGSYSAASKEFEEVLKAIPDLAVGHAKLGIALADMGRLNEAIVQFQAALQIRPDYPAVRRDLEQAQNMLLNNGGKDSNERNGP
jgi:tetratricopeptide (TPR) repeat protein